jgi:hypothetical protein
VLTPNHRHLLRQVTPSEVAAVLASRLLHAVDLLHLHPGPDRLGRERRPAGRVPADVRNTRQQLPNRRLAQGREEEDWQLSASQSAQGQDSRRAHDRSEPIRPELGRADTHQSEPEHRRAKGTPIGPRVLWAIGSLTTIFFQLAYYFQVCLAKSLSPDDLVTKVQGSKHRTASDVVSERASTHARSLDDLASAEHFPSPASPVTKPADDDEDDITVGALTLGLKCPVRILLVRAASLRPATDTHVDTSASLSCRTFG